MKKTKSDYHERLGQYVRVIADSMRLRDWTLMVDREPCDIDNHASIACADQRKVAVIQFSASTSHQDQDTIRHTVVHELIHPHFHQLLNAIYDLEPHLGAAAFKTFLDRCVDALEYGVDAMADAVSPLMPTMEELKI